MQMRALVTGASAGLGAEFARQLAADGFSLVLVARDADRLRALADELPVETEVLPADLTSDAGLELAAARLGDASRPVDVLVNNAGFAVAEPFHASVIEDERRMHELLSWVPLRLAHAALPGMRARGRGGILNVASLAGRLPSGSYAAAKSQVITLSRALNARYHRDGVTVTALLPGFVPTEFHDRMGVSPDVVPRAGWSDASTVVRDGLHALRRRRGVVVSDWRYRLAAPLIPLVPDRVIAGVGLGGRIGR
ncbi:SDR family NAD(P)-dependent oxidoreductase [Agrococcus sp. ARC_14]|uniref:SDR family NAD(P)-dependent oxidoreductase n=1 Tax=Agrococcus sp. ARC_14 TaxID=2919927 RepID=UPI001F069C64|nr:SDR family NAD(P)-dependent oxidoreductase [Agrococcus sp. ARC_14]MCH1882661.1 SDR family NAD(P)-dependent oxidoreductase [Agrococcus sp. ARC_14]